MTSLSKRIKAARTRAHLTQADLARLTGQSRAAISLWENGSTKTLNAESAIRAADALNVSIRWLIHGSGSMHESPLSAQAQSLARAYDAMSDGEQREVVGYIKYVLSRVADPQDASPLESLVANTRRPPE